MPFRESDHVGNPHRAAYREQTRDLVRRRFADAAAMREVSFTPDTSGVAAYAASIETYRERFRDVLGWPNNAPRPATPPAVRREPVAEDELGTIERLWIEALPDWWLYTVVLTPHAPPDRPAGRPAAICQHGGQGTPELVANFFEQGNYGDVARRVLTRGVTVVLPQLMLWAERFNDELPDPEAVPRGEPAGVDRAEIDNSLRALGGTIIGLEAFGLTRVVDALTAWPGVDADRLGMIGLSYGSIYTLVTGAIEPRLRVLAPSAAFSDGSNFRRMGDVALPGTLLEFGPAEWAAMICPRPLGIEIGRHDEHLVVANAETQIPSVRRWYDALGIGDRFEFFLNDGGHEIGYDDRQIAWFNDRLLAADG